jgi:hypothetical protein
MNKSKSKKEKEFGDVKDEYDFSDGVRGKYAKRFAEGTNIVVLEPDVAEMFPDSSSVNEALRALVRIARRENRNGAGPQ